MRQALGDFDKALELQPGYGKALVDRGDLYDDLNEFPSAVRDFTAALEFDKSDAKVFHARAYSLQQMARFRDAVADYSAALALDPANGHTLNNRGNCKLELGDVAGAIADLDAAIAINPTLGYSFVHRGNARLALANAAEGAAAAAAEVAANVALAHEDFRAAIERHTTMIEQQQHSHTMRVSRGRAFHGLGRYDEALRDYEAAYALNPDSFDACNYMARTRTALGLLEPALLDITKAIRLNPFNARLLLERAELYRRLGNLPLCIEDYTCAYNVCCPRDQRDIRTTLEKLKALPRS